MALTVPVIDATATHEKAVLFAAKQLSESQPEFSFPVYRVDALSGIGDAPVKWANAAKAIREACHRETRSESHSFAVGIIEQQLENNWFSFTDHNVGCAVVTTHEWELVSYLPIESYLAIEILLNLQEFLVGWRDDYSHAHLNTIGCINDMCGYKPDISFKIRTGDVCPTCLSVWKQKLTESQISSLINGLETVRRIALSRNTPRAKMKNLERPLEEELVFPVAVLLRLMRQELEPTRRFFRLMDLFDMTVRFSVISIAALYLSMPYDEVDALRGEVAGYVTNRPTLGTWVQALPRMLERLTGADTPVLPEELAQVRKAHRLIERNGLVRLRNDTRGHGYTEEGHRYDYRFREYSPVVSTILGLLRGILTKRLVSVMDLDYDGGQYLATVRLLVGSNPLFSTDKIRLPTPLRRNDVAIMTSENRAIRLNPLVVWTVCPMCKHSRVLVTDDPEQGQNFYLDPYSGHRVRIDVNDPPDTTNI